MVRATPPYGRRSVSGMPPEQLRGELKSEAARIDVLEREKLALEQLSQTESATARERDVASRKLDRIVKKIDSHRKAIVNLAEAHEKELSAVTRSGEGYEKYDKTLRRAQAIIRQHSTQLQKLKSSHGELSQEIKKLEESETKLTNVQKRKLQDLKEADSLIKADIKAKGKLGEVTKEVTKLGADMMGALGAGGVGKYVGKAGLWGVLAAGVVEFTGALKNAHDQLRAVRNEGILLGGMMGGPGGAMGGRGAVAGQFMGRSFAHRLMTGQTEQEQAQFMGAGIRSGVFSNIEDIYGRGGSPGSMTQMWALGRTTGIAPEALLGQGQELMKAGVPRGQIGQALLDLANNARDAGAGIEDYLTQVMSLNQSTRKYGATLEENELIVRHFMKYLQEGSLTLADLAGIMGAGAMGKGMRGARGFIAEAAAGAGAYGDIFAGPEWAGVRGEYAGLGPVAGGARMRAAMEAGGAEGLKAREGYVKMADAIATAIVEREIGFKEGTPEFLEYYSDAMEQFGISTGETLKSAEAIHKAAEMLGDPAAMMRTAAEGFMLGQGKFEKNIADLTDRVLDDYEKMKGIQQIMSEVIMTAMYTISIGLNELLAELGVGVFADEERGEEVKRGMYAGLAMTTGGAIAAAKEADRRVTPGMYGLAGLAASRVFSPESGTVLPEYAHMVTGRERTALSAYGWETGMFTGRTKGVTPDMKERVEVEKETGKVAQALRYLTVALTGGAAAIYGAGAIGVGLAKGGVPGAWGAYMKAGRQVFTPGVEENYIAKYLSAMAEANRSAVRGTPYYNVNVNFDTDEASMEANVDSKMGELARRMKDAARKADIEKQNKIDEKTIRDGVYAGWK